jgi:hypothetical protein
VKPLYHETKIPTVDMKVMIYYNFSKKVWKKSKPPSSMRNGRFHPPKCRGKVQKMGVLYTHSSKMLGPSPNFFIRPQKKLNEKIAKKGGSREGSPQSAFNHELPPSKIFLLLPAHNFLHMWSTLIGWFQHMPALPQLLLRFSNIHNF